MPGGATYFNQSNGYHDAGRIIYEIAIDLNRDGIYFPVWGTCLGMELLVYLSADGLEPRSYCSSMGQSLPLEFLEGLKYIVIDILLLIDAVYFNLLVDFKTSRLFKKADDEIINILSRDPVTANFHMYCFTQDTFKEMHLNNEWRVMSLNHDWNGFQFISIIEHRRYE